MRTTNEKQGESETTSPLASLDVADLYPIGGIIIIAGYILFGAI